ncbi:unnamed protein product [Lathyrus sativus]|nr:unnamed protein product [Lathyrus sativus]
MMMPSFLLHQLDFKLQKFLELYFEDKPQCANDAWRKLHFDPLLMICQRKQETLAKIKNNPVKMVMSIKSNYGRTAIS